MITPPPAHGPWQMSTVGAHFDVQLGKMLDAARNAGDPKLYLGNRAVQWGRIDMLAAGMVPLTREDQIRYRLKTNDLLVCEGGEVGRAAIWQGEPDECYYQKALHRLRTKAGFDPRVMMALLEYWSETNAFNNYVTRTSIAHLPRERLLTIPLPIIPPCEQERIAAVIDDTNSLIAKLDQIIVKKEAIKRGMMRELFSAKTQPDEMVTLGSITTWLSGGTPDRGNASYWSGAIPWISATTLKELEVNYSDQAVTPAGVKAGSTMAPVESTLLLVRGSALHSEIRASLVTRPLCFNQDIKALVPFKRVVPKFLTYSIHGNAESFLRLVTLAGNTAGVLDTQVIKRFEIWLPDKTAQRQVVTILDDLSHEIQSLKTRLTKSKAIKRGMMQELLTGRIRLPVSVAIPA
jgi:type I restriction enzyme, S subunit